MKTIKFTFNTGRMYTEAGQIIHVEVLPHERIYFHDESRGIAASFPYQQGVVSQSYVEELVMRCYDHGTVTYERMPKRGEARWSEE